MSQLACQSAVAACAANKEIFPFAVTACDAILQRSSWCMCRCLRGSSPFHVTTLRCCITAMCQFGSLHDVQSHWKSSATMCCHSRSLHSAIGCIQSLLRHVSPCRKSPQPNRLQQKSPLSRRHAVVSRQCANSEVSTTCGCIGRLLRRCHVVVASQGLLPSLGPNPINPHLLVLIDLDLMWPPINRAARS